MDSRALDDFIDDCFIKDDDICKFEVYRTRKYENKNNWNTTELISALQQASKVI